MTRPVVEVAMAGGLGNQMFQYAAGRALSLAHDARLVLDTSFYRSGRHRTFQLDQFEEPRLHADIRHPTRLQRVAKSLGLGHTLPVWKETGVAPDPDFIRITPPIRLEGYFQSSDHFAAIGPSIRRELEPPMPKDRASIAHAAHISEACSLHVRRGDYVSNPKAAAMFASCSMDYYRAALEKIPQGTDVFVFSDDLEWARKNLPPIRNFVFVGDHGPRDGLADLWLMSRARHHIIANSSFSWWGAWLSGPGRGVTIAPLRWFNDPAIDDRRLVPDGWIRLPG